MKLRNIPPTPSSKNRPRTRSLRLATTAFFAVLSLSCCKNATPTKKVPKTDNKATPELVTKQEPSKKDVSKRQFLDPAFLEAEPTGEDLPQKADKTKESAPITDAVTNEARQLTDEEESELKNIMKQLHSETERVANGIANLSHDTIDKIGSESEKVHALFNAYKQLTSSADKPVSQLCEELSAYSDILETIENQDERIQILNRNVDQLLKDHLMIMLKRIKTEEKPFDTDTWEAFIDERKRFHEIRRVPEGRFNLDIGAINSDG